MCKVFDVSTDWYEEKKGETLGGLLQDTKLIKKKRKAEPTDTAVASLEPVGKTRKKDKAKKDKATKKKEDDEPAKAGPATAAAAAAALSDAQSAAQKKARKKARRLAREQRDAAQPSGSRLSSS